MTTFPDECSVRNYADFANAISGRLDIEIHVVQHMPAGR